MKQNLEEVNRIKGVSESLLFNKWGELVIPQLQYKDTRIANLGKEIAYCKALIEKVKQEIDFVEIIYEDRRIVVRMSELFFIVVVCTGAADIPMIKLTMNVLNEEIKGDKEIQKTLRKSQTKIDLLSEAQKEADWKELLGKLGIYR